MPAMLPCLAGLFLSGAPAVLAGEGWCDNREFPVPAPHHVPARPRNDDPTVLFYSFCIVGHCTALHSPS